MIQYIFILRLWVCLWEFPSFFGWESHSVPRLTLKRPVFTTLSEPSKPISAVSICSVPGQWGQGIETYSTPNCSFGQLAFRLSWHSSLMPLAFSLAPKLKIQRSERWQNSNRFPARTFSLKQEMYQVKSVAHNIIPPWGRQFVQAGWSTHNHYILCTSSSRLVTIHYWQSPEELATLLPKKIAQTTCLPHHSSDIRQVRSGLVAGWALVVSSK